MKNDYTDGSLRKKQKGYEILVAVRIKKSSYEALKNLVDKHFLSQPEVIRHGIDKIVEDLTNKLEGNAA